MIKLRKLPAFEWLVFRDTDPETGRSRIYRDGSVGTRFTYYWIVSLEFWNANGHLDDQHISGDFPPEVRKLLAEDMESHFEYRGTLQTFLPQIAKHGFLYVGDMP